MRKEEEGRGGGKAGGSKGNHLSSIKKRLSAKYPPSQEKKNFTVDFPMEGHKTTALPPKITHSVHILSVSQTKASLIQSALSSDGGGGWVMERGGGGSG